MDAILQDLRYGVRRLLRTPATTAVAVLSLALGIGANATIFSAIDALVLRPLPFEQPDRLIGLFATYPERGGGHWSVSYPNFADWRKGSRAFEGMAAVYSTGYALSGRERPERLAGARVSANLFSVLRTPPVLGRGFRADEDRPGADPVVMLGHGLWQRRFGTDPGVVGSQLRLDGTSYTVVGVMPPGFDYPGGTQVWTPLRENAESWNRFSGGLQVVGRLRPGVPLERARAELSAVAGRLEAAYPEANAGQSAGLVPLAEGDYGEQLRTGLYVLLAAVGFVLLIACVNVANLLLARAATRGKEIAVRTAIGAGRARLVRQLLTESILLALAGGALGVLLALWGTDVLAATLPEWLPGVREIGVDPRVLGFALALSVVTGLMFGLVPALLASKPDVTGLLKEGGHGATTGRRSGRGRDLLVVSEVALSVVLLVAAGLMITSFVRLRTTDPGFEPEELLTFQLSLGSGYAEDGEITAFYRRALERIEAVPGVETAAAVNTIPLGGTNNFTDLEIEGWPVADPADRPNVGEVIAAPGYLRTMRIPLLGGRDFAERDRADAPGVALVNRTMAGRYWPGENPIGKRLKRTGDAEWMTMVGVVGDVRHGNLEDPPRPEVYTPLAQTPRRAMTLVVRSAADPAALLPALRSAIWSVDPDQPLYDVMTMEQRVGERLIGPRLVGGLLGAFGAVALLLAAIGIYGVISYSVAQRTREIGIRVALGARRESLLRMVVGRGMTVTLVGVVVGLAAAFAVTRFMAGLLYGVGATDPATFAGVALVLTLVALLASYLPARRATRVDPMVALRAE